VHKASKGSARHENDGKRHEERPAREMGIKNTQLNLHAAVVHHGYAVSRVRATVTKAVSGLQVFTFRQIQEVLTRSANPQVGKLTFTMEEESRRQLIRRRLVERLLPRVHAVDVWDGVGDGRLCDACEAPITANQHAIQAIASLWSSLYLHAECFDLWRAERLAVLDIAPVA